MAVKVSGVRDVMRKLKQIEPELQRKALRTGVTKAAKAVLTEAKARAPVDTGALRDSIKLAPGKRKRGRVSRLVQIGEGDFKGKTWYGAAVEYGTSRQSAKPFMTPAYEVKADEARDIMIDETIKAVDAILRKMSTTGRLADAGSKIYKSASKSTKKLAKRTAKATKRATKAAKRQAKRTAKVAKRSAKSSRRALKRATKTTKKTVKRASKAARKQAKSTSKVVRRQAKKAKRAAVKQAQSATKSFKRRSSRRRRRK